VRHVTYSDSIAQAWRSLYTEREREREREREAERAILMASHTHALSLQHVQLYSQHIFAMCRDKTSYLTMQRIDDLQFEFPDNFPADAKSLVSELLREEPTDRLGADDIEKLKAHAFFSSACPHFLLYTHTTISVETPICYNANLLQQPTPVCEKNRLLPIC
jgi:hypothetical protein